MDEIPKPKNFQDQLNDLITANLPAQTAKAMREYLEEAEQTKEKLEDALEELQKLKKIEERYVSIAKEIEQTRLATETNNEWAKKLKERQTELAILAVKNELQAEKKVTEKMFTIMELFVKNPRSIEIMAASESRSKSALDQYGSYRTTESENNSSTTAKEKLETKSSYLNTGGAMLPEQPQ